MATRFGAFSPAQTYAAKVRWLVGCLLAVIAILVLTLIFVAKDAGGPGSSIPTDAVATKVDPHLSPTVDIIIAGQRIEGGAQILDHMLATQPVPTERIPDGALRAHEKQLVIGRFATSLLSANMPILKDYIADVPPIEEISIPAGYRAVTIEVSARSGVEGWARAKSRVDVLWTYTDKDSQRKVATIVRYSKVLSVAGVTSAKGKAAVAGNQNTPVTLLVTEKEAKKIELARTLGTLSLSLVGHQEDVKLDSDDPSDVVDIDTILGTTSTVDEEVPADGTMYSIDSKTGKRVRYLLRGKKWIRDPSFAD